MATDRQEQMNTQPALERIIRAKLAALTEKRIQNDIERMSADLRQQGASEDDIRASADWFAEQSQRDIIETAADAAKRLVCDLRRE